MAVNSSGSRSAAPTIKPLIPAKVRYSPLFFVLSQPPLRIEVSGAMARMAARHIGQKIAAHASTSFMDLGVCKPLERQSLFVHCGPEFFLKDKACPGQEEKNKDMHGLAYL